MKKKSLLILFAVMWIVSSVTFGAGATLAAGPVKLKVAIHFPPPPKPPKIPGATWQGILNYAERVKESTKGGVLIENYWGGQLGSPTEFVALAGSQGVADCAVLSIVYNKWEIPLTMGRTLPFLTCNMTAQHKGFWELYETWKPYKDEWDKVNLKPLWSTISPPYSLATKGPVRTLDDLKGMKIWGSGYYADALNAVGAQVISTPAGEVFDLLSKGTIQGVFFPYDGHKNFGWWELVNYHLNVDFVGAKSEQIFVINKGVWNKLSKDDQKAMLDAAVPQHEEFLKNYRAENLSLNKEYAEKGHKFYELSSADQEKWQKLVGPKVEKEWLEQMEKRGQGNDARELLKRFKAMIAKYPGCEFIWPK